MTSINEYHKSFIYKIISSSPDFEEHMTYYGSTKRTLKIRMDCHRSGYKNNILECCSSKKIFDKYGIDNCFIEEVKKCNCEDKYELRLIEASYIKNYPCCNDRIPSGINTDNMREWRKEYYENHKEEIKEYCENHKEERKEYNKEYRENHKEEIKEYRKKYNDSHKEEIKEYYDNHTEEIKKYNKKYNDSHKEDRKRLYRLKKKLEKQEK